MYTIHKKVERSLGDKLAVRCRWGTNHYPALACHVTKCLDKSIYNSIYVDFHIHKNVLFLLAEKVSGASDAVIMLHLIISKQYNCSIQILKLLIRRL